MNKKNGLIVLFLLILTVSFFFFDPARGEASAAVDPYHQILETCIAWAIIADQSIIKTALAITACSALYEALHLINYIYLGI
ncbi:MAG: hypothetical protein KBI45_00410 [Candidatus Saccharicenans sp.]|jgi:hypothetical protein|nr:hypothetical protein [Candidatus Saccharicenans sp.]